MPKPVTDPAILAMLNAQESTAPAKKPIDPAILAQLNAEQAPPEKANWWSRVNDAASGVNRGLATIGGMGIDAMADLRDLGKSAVGSSMIALGKDVPNWAQIGDRSNDIGTGAWLAKKLDQGTTALGGGSATELSHPEDAASRYLHAGGMGLAGAALAPAAGARLLPAALAGTTSAVASQGTADVGGGPAAQALAGIIGGAVPGLARMKAQELIRGNPEQQQKTAQNIADFERAGTTPSAGQATERRVAQAAESALSKSPGSAGPMAEKAAQQAKNVGAKVDSLAESLATRSDSESAGKAIIKGVSGEGGYVEKFRKTRDKLYDTVGTFLPKNSRVSAGNTQAALAELNSKIPGAENTSNLFQNKRMTEIESALSKDVNSPSAQQKKLDSLLAKIDELDASRNGARQDQGRFMEKEAFAGNRKDNDVRIPGMPRVPGKYSPFEGRRGEAKSAAQDADLIASQRQRESQDLQDLIPEFEAAAKAANGKLPYEAIKKLRTLVGRELDSPSLVSDVPRAQWTKLYGGLSEDMKAAANAAGPKARQAWTRADQYNKLGKERIEALDHVVDRHGGPEAVFKAAISGTSEGATTLKTVMKSLGEEERKVVSASVLRRLGRATPGNQNDASSVFSMETFLSNWDRLSPQAKSTLFDRYGGEFRKDMNAIARVASNVRDGSKVYRNPSGTGSVNALTYTVGGTVSAMFGALMNSHPGAAAAIAAGTGGALTGLNRAAKAMTNLANVRKLAEPVKAPTSGLPAAVVATRPNETEEQKKRRLRAEALRSN